MTSNGRSGTNEGDENRQTTAAQQSTDCGHYDDENLLISRRPNRRATMASQRITAASAERG